LLLLESKPGAVIDPTAMINLALQDALLLERKDLILEIAGDWRVICPRKYKPPSKEIHLYEHPSKNSLLTPSAAAVVGNQRFRQLLEKSIEELSRDIPDNDLVRKTKLHMALLLMYRETKDQNFAEELCWASSLKERSKKSEW